MISDKVEELLEPFFQKIIVRDVLGAEERRAIVAAADEQLQFTAGDDLISEGQRASRSMLVASGFTCRYNVVLAGERQLSAIHVPGDFVDLHSLLLKKMDHSVGALTHCTVFTFPHERLVELTERYPHLTRILWLLTLLDGAIHREWLVGMARLSAEQRTAHLICELYTRLKIVGLAVNHEFELPTTQASLADALGISTVHVNRVLQELRQQNLIVWGGGRLTIRNFKALVELADFDDRYLHLIQESR